jgi:uncharacterized protein YneF (UPF0154 family)
VTGLRVLLLVVQIACLAGAAVSLFTARRYLRRAEQLQRNLPVNSTAAREDQSRAANGPTPKPGRQEP